MIIWSSYDSSSEEESSRVVLVLTAHCVDVTTTSWDTTDHKDVGHIQQNRNYRRRIAREARTLTRRKVAIMEPDHPHKTADLQKFLGMVVDLFSTYSLLLRRSTQKGC